MNLYSSKFLANVCSSLLITFIAYNSFGQQNNNDKKLDSTFINYSKPYKEVVYAHLNKSTYLKDESIGFTAYVLNAKENTLSTKTKNLYCVITDKNNNVIKQKLLNVKNGIANNVFNIDSLFVSGDYQFKAFTNWMLNFEQQNYFVQPFKVIDLDDDDALKKEIPSTDLDIQFLPESGHLINNVVTTMGVIVKNYIGNGLTNIKGKVVDNENNIVTQFSLNDLGIGRFYMLPNSNKNYSAEIDYNGKKLIFPIKTNINKQGVNLKLVQVRDYILLSAITNKETLNQLENKNFVVTNHNSHQLKKIDFTFSDNETETKKIFLKNLFPGINIFMLFDAQHNPIAERLFFNYEGVSILKSSEVSVINKNEDSLSVKINYKDFKTAKFNNVSVAILPLKTKSYNKNNNIISQTLLQPYINNYIENAGYYFSNITEQKKYDLDNLLITQGWSSYNWEEIFKEELVLQHEFENGINLKIIIPKNKRGQKYFFHKTEKKLSNIVEIDKNTNSFEALGYEPEENEPLYISNMSKKGKFSPADLSIQFYPKSFPVLETENNIVKSQNYYVQEEYFDNKLVKNSLSNVQKLDEIVLTTNLEKERIEKIENNTIGEVTFFNQEEAPIYEDLLPFFRSKGIIAERKIGTGDLVLAINRPSPSFTSNTIVPVVFINDFLIPNLNQILWLDLNTIDYIAINKSGNGEGILGANGSIKIYTDNSKARSNRRKTASKFKFPITFSDDKKFYRPIYQSYDSKFYNHYGTIDWLPKNKIDENGDLIFTFKNGQSNSIKLFIEGITENGAYIFEEKYLEN